MLFVLFQLIFQLGCGSDNKCVTDISLYTKSSTDLIILGQDRLYNITISLRNRLEAAYQTVVDLEFSDRIQYIGTSTTHGDEFVVCKPKKSTQISCNAGNPIRSGVHVQFVIRVSLALLTSDRAQLEYSINATTKSEEALENLMDNTRYVAIPINMIASPTLVGYVYAILHRISQLLVFVNSLTLREHHEAIEP